MPVVSERLQYPKDIPLTNEQQEIIDLKRTIRDLQARIEQLELRLNYSDRH